MQHTTIYTILSIFFYNTTHTTIHYNAMPYHAIKKLHNTVQNTFYSTRPLYKTTQCNMFYNTHYNTCYNTNTTEHHTTQHNTTHHKTIQYYNTIQTHTATHTTMHAMRRATLRQKNTYSNTHYDTYYNRHMYHETYYCYCTCDDTTLTRHDTTHHNTVFWNATQRPFTNTMHNT